MDYLINTFLGFAIAQLVSISRRNIESEKSPTKLNIWFFLKDTWLKIMLSLILSVLISMWMNKNIVDVQSVLSFINFEKIPLSIIYTLLGLSPEFVLQIINKKTGLFKPKTVQVKVSSGFEKKVETFVRK